MQATAHPGPFSRTNAGLADGFLAYSGKGGALEMCNADKASLRLWAQSVKK